MVKNFKVAIPLFNNEINGNTGWVAGLYFVKNCLNAIAKVEGVSSFQIIIFVPENFSEVLLCDKDDQDVSWLHIVKIPMQYLANIEMQSEVGKIIDSYHCDITFPITSMPSIAVTGVGFGWLPDLQEKYFPEFFSNEELAFRDATIRFLTLFSKKILCTSQSVANDLVQFYPSVVGKEKIIHFRTCFPEAFLMEDPKIVLEKYNIKEPYFYLPNQFWKHKNHMTVFEAWRLLKEKGITPTLVCTGSQRDYRFPNYYSELEQFLNEQSLSGGVKILGFVTREDQIQLYRRARAILQPSLFEGWSTSIEEAKALGKRLIVSDIATHREQEEGYAVQYFEKTDAQTLALLVEKNLQNTEASYEEKTCYEKYQEHVKKFGIGLLEVFSELVGEKDNSVGREKVDFLVGLNRQIASKEKMIAALKRVADERSDVINELKKANDALEAMAQDLKKVCDEREKLINDLVQTCKDREKVILEFQKKCQK